MSRRAARAGIVGAALTWFVVAVSMLAASPAMALNRDDGDDPGPSISRMEILAIFVGIPVASMALIWLLVSIPSMVRGPRYRPGKQWQANSEWYGAPGDEPAAIESGSAGPAIEGRAPDSAVTGTIVEPAEGGSDAAGGGTSARW